MEKLVEDEHKGSREKRALALLEGLQAKHSPGDTIFYIRRSTYSSSRFLDLDLELVKFLETEGIVKMTENDYMRDGAVDPNVITLHLQPKGEELLRSRVVTTTQTVTETFQDPEEPTWKRNKKFRNFARTERGGAILCASPEALISDIKGNIQALARGDLSRSEWKARQFWLKYWLLYRREDIPPALVVEAEDYRDAQFTSRRRNAKKQADSLPGGKI